MIHATMPAKMFYCSLFNSSAINLHTEVHIYTDCDEDITFLAEVRTAGNLTKPGLIWLHIKYTRMIYTSRNKRILTFTTKAVSPLTCIMWVQDSDIKVWAWRKVTDHDDVWGREMLKESPGAQSTPFRHSPKQKKLKQIRKYLKISCSLFHLL